VGNSRGNHRAPILTHRESVLDTLSSTLDQLAPELGSTFRGLTKLLQGRQRTRRSAGWKCSKDGADVTGYCRNPQANR